MLGGSNVLTGSAAAISYTVGSRVGPYHSSSSHENSTRVPVTSYRMKPPLAAFIACRRAQDSFGGLGEHLGIWASEASPEGEDRPRPFT
nr:hypothetical protein CFP56_13307 [Quercus suber]